MLQYVLSNDAYLYSGLQWGEPVVHFLACIQQHAFDRGLETEKGWVHGVEVKPHPGWLGGRSPHYWGAAPPPRSRVVLTVLAVCAYANRQHCLEGMDENAALSDSPFYLAMKLAKGTVSIVDSEGKMYTRLWYTLLCLLTLTAYSVVVL